MAEGYNSRAAVGEPARMTTSFANGGPPPSTLAAQLVENISVSSRNSRPDENSELKGLFSIIQRVKDDPESLKTPEERVEHNHMLIYVYSRVVLENLKLDDPFLDRAHVRSEALKAINFLRFTIKETPSVLVFQGGDHGLLFRGKEPLWVWLLPHILRLLGHPQCLELEGPIEGFLQYLFLVTPRNGVLWEFAKSLVLYLRATLTGLVDHLQNSKFTPTSKDMSLALDLPPPSTLQQILGDVWSGTTMQRIIYPMAKVSQALRQAMSLGKVLAYPLICQEPILSCMSSVSESSLWLLDTLLDLRYIQRRWDSLVKTSPISTIEIVLDMLKAFTNGDHALEVVQGKMGTSLVLLCSEVILTSSDELTSTDSNKAAAKFTFCSTLLHLAKLSLHSQTISRLASSRLVNEFISPTSDRVMPEPDTDVWRSMDLLKQASSSSPTQSLAGVNFDDERLRDLAGSLQLPMAPSQSVQNTQKKRKLSKDKCEPPSILQQVYSALGLNEPEETQYLGETILESCSKASEDTQCLVLELTSQLCCITQTENTPEGTTRQKKRKCHICKAAGLSEAPSGVSQSDVEAFFSKLIASPDFLKSRRPRVAAMITLRRLVLHCKDPDFFNLETSTCGQWCLQSLHSSIRELRIAAGRTLPAFATRTPDASVTTDLMERNRKNMIAFLKSISEKAQPHLVETCIMAWGQLGRVVVEDELNLVLIMLLEYLSSSNSLESAFAFNELQNLADALGTSPRRLLEPFWESLAYSATKDMVQRPQKSRAIAELLQISINELLLVIQTHALPWLVLYKRKDVVQKIAEARKETDVLHSLTDSANFAAILSLLLMQETENVESFVKSRLGEISPDFHGQPFSKILLLEPVLTVMELLKAAGDGDSTRREQGRAALRKMALAVQPSTKETRNKKENTVGRFLQNYILGLMARLTDVINDSVASSQPVMEQRRCIRALEEMIRLGKGYVRIARPQISACLLSALAQDELRETSFSCWASMLAYLEEEDVEALLETTFFIVGRYWASLNSATSEVVHRMLNHLLERHEIALSNCISRLPSLSHIAELEKVNSKLDELRPALIAEEALEVFAQRLGHDNSGVVQQALKELVPYLKENQSALYTSAVSQRPDATITTLLRALLDCACKNTGSHTDIPQLCAECIGLIGCLDSNQIEAVREQRTIVILDNFATSDEMTDFTLFLLEVVLVPSFLSATDTKLQGFLSFAMQELLDRSEIRAACEMQSAGILEGAGIYRKWVALPESVREVVTPFLSSHYLVAPMVPAPIEYPLFRPGRLYVNWLRSFAIDLLRKGQTPFADMIFEPLTRVIRVKDVRTAEFLLPYLVLHILVGGRSSDQERSQVMGEILGILQHQPPNDASSLEREDTNRFCQAVFNILDYAMRWIHAKKATGQLSTADKTAVARVQAILDDIPADLIAQRAIDCNEYSRALFHLEQHAQKMEQQKRAPDDRTKLLERLQDIYANIDEPDGLDGISAHLHNFDINQQILSHKKAGRWAQAQTWHEMQLAENPDNLDVQVDLLNCLKQAGQHDVLLNHVEGMRSDALGDHKIMPFAVEAAWVTGRWESLLKFTNRFEGSDLDDFNISLGVLLGSLHRSGPSTNIKTMLQDMRAKIASSMTPSATASLQAAHEILLKCHVLTDLEFIVGAKSGSEEERKTTKTLLEGRLQVIGAYFSDKQYLLGIQRAVMELTRPNFADLDVSSLWLSSARLARKSNFLHQSFSAVLHASRLGDDAASIENAKLLWRDNQHRKAIQMLQGAIERNKFMTQTGGTLASVGSKKMDNQQKLLTARAQLLLAKWLDAAGQTQADALREKYQQPPKTFNVWEKGHYHLGRVYKKFLEAEKPLHPDEQSDAYVTGEMARLVIENYVRSLHCGTKYLYQTLPRILTIWLDLGADINKPPEGKSHLSRELHKRRLEQLNMLHSFLDKYIHRLPAYVFYTALPQIVARIAHNNANVFERLVHIIVKVVEAHPRQALWSLIGVMTTKQDSDRKSRTTAILTALRSTSKKSDRSGNDLRALLKSGEKLAEQLLLACQNGEFQGNKTVHASLSRDLRFNHKCTPCGLAVPVESSLTATLPTFSEALKKHQAFSRDVVTIDCFLDDVLVLSSLAKPRRLTARGSDGKSYMLLIKPKDDLRTDQRLMEFNAMINRSLKRDAESSRRQLYIRTYAVVPLNEECGIIEWVPGIRTMRDILLNLYASQKIYPDYMTLKRLMEDAATSDSKIRIFTDDVLGRFPPMLQVWFVQQFPNPSAWFSARLKYTRSCAVMSMVGTILGLGDRHGENVNLEEGSGGIFHVDFNCLFDKGLTFAMPERVPFRLTHNMVAAMGIYGYEGPFRKSCELTLSILRQQEETLMTILEAFIYDPTLDLQKEKKALKRGDVVVKLQPQSVVETIKRKVNGLLANERIPLGVEGQVDELIRQAVDPRNLTAMYIGWCPFF